ncbi:MAG: hypothetical protein K2P84_04465 [Undibacterium sp.]|nr:hypothetical protein [Undibacterium sp.]
MNYLKKIANVVFVICGLATSVFLMQAAHAYISNGPGGGSLWTAAVRVPQPHNPTNSTAIIILQASSKASCQILVDNTVTSYTYSYPPTGVLLIPQVIRPCQLGLVNIDNVPK